MAAGDKNKIEVAFVADMSDLDKKLDAAGKKVEQTFATQVKAPVEQAAAKVYAAQPQPTTQARVAGLTTLSSRQMEAKMEAAAEAAREATRARWRAFAAAHPAGGAKTHSMMPDWFLKQAQTSASSMGSLFPPAQAPSTWMQKLGTLGSSSSLVGTLNKLGAAFPAVAGFAKVAGLVTGAFVALRVALGIASYAVGLFVRPIMRLVGFLAQFALDERLYPRVLASGGMPASYVSKFTMASRVSGISESDIVKFGTNLRELNDMVAVAARTFAETMVPLTSLKWQMNTVSENWTALWRQFTAALEPSVGAFLQTLNSVMRSNQIIGLMTVLGQITNAFLGLLVIIYKYTSTMMMAISLLAQAIADLMYALVHLQRPDFTKTKEVFGEMRNIWRHQGQPQEQPGMAQRMPVSAWERMGLVLGMGPGVNHAAETARNTRTMAAALRQIEMNTGTMASSRFALVNTL